MKARDMAASTWKTGLLMLLTAAIWGSTFVAQQLGMDSVGPFTYTAARLMLGLALIAPLWWRRGAHRGGYAVGAAGSAPLRPAPALATGPGHAAGAPPCENGGLEKSG
ncbi:EamA family transporter [Tepidimonas sp.]|uniref:EamA family transporter n=1 Tax=Tepidimonas sp. TaxID=2002775 RepID=UPI0028D0B3EA|nr:EamA family transporter [Tepidimonas sp.]